MGHVGIQYPDRTTKAFPKNILHNHHRYFTGIDKDYEFIHNYTRVSNQLSEHEANAWFCMNKGADDGTKHTVFERERSHSRTSSIPLLFIKNHQSQCKRWLKMVANITGAANKTAPKTLAEALASMESSSALKSDDAKCPMDKQEEEIFAQEAEREMEEGAKETEKIEVAEVQRDEQDGKLKEFEELTKGQKK